MAELTETTAARFKVFNKGTESSSPKKESQLDNHFIHIVGVAIQAEDWAGVEKGEILRPEVPEQGQVLYLF